MKEVNAVDVICKLNKDIVQLRIENEKKQETIDDLCSQEPCPKCGYGVTGQCYGCVIKKLRTENERLKEFARYVIRTECWSLGEQDGGEIQELAEKLGLIESHTATEEDVDDESDIEIGDSIYIFSEALKPKETDSGTVQAK